MLFVCNKEGFQISAQAQPQSARQEIHQAPVPIPIPDPIPAPVLPAPLAPAAIPPVPVQAPAQQALAPPPEQAQVQEIAEINNVTETVSNPTILPLILTLRYCYRTHLVIQM